ncbi:MAG: DUF751 family protein [Cyanobacteria bacterium P01_H01_bin.121]
MKDFFDNVLRYQRYIITVLLGVLFYAFEWLRPLLRSRVSIVAFISLIVASFTFVALTLRAMLGLGI